jgi:hypothetical protein
LKIWTWHHGVGGYLIRGMNCLLFATTLCSPPVLMGSMLLIFLFSVMCCIVLLCFVCLRPVSCVPIVASVSWLSIPDCPLGFLYRLFITVFGFTRTGTELTIYHNAFEVNTLTILPQLQFLGIENLPSVFSYVYFHIVSLCHFSKTCRLHSV